MPKKCSSEKRATRHQKGPGQKKKFGNQPTSEQAKKNPHPNKKQFFKKKKTGDKHK